MAMGAKDKDIQPQMFDVVMRISSGVVFGEGTYLQYMEGSYVQSQKLSCKRPI